MNDIGVLGLGVMGKSLARNFANKGVKVSVYNVPLKGEENVTNDFVQQYDEGGFYGANSLTDFVNSLSSPRQILLMIKSGQPVDEMMNQLIPILDKGDCIIDAGNSFFKDSQRRHEYAHHQGIHFVGMGVSGGEEGALKGPSIMPAGTQHSKESLLPLLEKIAAKKNGEPCVRWIGKGGAGHFVKMVHNGIEYADMQMITEIYAIYKWGLGYDNKQIANKFESFNKSIHNSYLVEITIDILRKKIDDSYVLDEILDVAGHKGTGMWTSREALELGVAVPSITAAMNQRIISSYKSIRKDFHQPIKSTSIDANISIEKALLAGRLNALAEGFHLMYIASKHYDWDLNMQDIAAVWRGGCIIRSEMLPLIMEAFEEDISHLYYSSTFKNILDEAMNHLNLLIGTCTTTGIPLPSLNAASEYYKSMTCNNLSINLIQAQRDYFGAHTYRTIDNPELPKHTQWK